MSCRIAEINNNTEFFWKNSIVNIRNREAFVAVGGEKTIDRVAVTKVPEMPDMK